MTMLLTTKCANQAIRSTSAVYHVAKATEIHGEEAVISEMARMERERSGATYGESIIRAAIEHTTIMNLCTRSQEYKQISENLSMSESMSYQSLTA